MPKHLHGNFDKLLKFYEVECNAFEFISGLPGQTFCSSLKFITNFLNRPIVTSYDSDIETQRCLE